MLLRLLPVGSRENVIKDFWLIAYLVSLSLARIRSNQIIHFGKDSYNDLCLLTGLIENYNLVLYFTVQVKVYVILVCRITSIELIFGIFRRQNGKWRITLPQPGFIFFFVAPAFLFNFAFSVSLSPPPPPPPTETKWSSLRPTH